MSLDDSDEKLALLQEIRDEVLGLRSDVAQRLAGLGGKIDRGLDRIDRVADGMHRGFDRVDAALAEYAEQVRLTVHYVRVLAGQSGIEIERG